MKRHVSKLNMNTNSTETMRQPLNSMVIGQQSL